MAGAGQKLTYAFRGFHLDPGRRRLVAPDGGAVRLSSRAFDTLLYMVERPGELLDKATLMRAVWPDTVVEENNLNQAVTAVRKALGEKPADRRFIRTEPGRGYRFVADVAIPTENAQPGPDRPQSRPAGTAEPLAAVTPPTESIAVLPFADMSPEQDQGYFADGIAEELLNHFSRLHDLRVAGRTSSFSFKDKNQDLREIGEKLNVAHILEGSVRKAGKRLRISVQLVKAADGYQLWSKSYDRDLADIFAIQDEIAQAVSDALSITLGVGGLGVSTRNVEAYEAFLEGRSEYTQGGREGYLRARQHLERATSLDPDFVGAWAVLANVCFYGAITWVPDRRSELLARFESAVANAISAAPDAADTLHANALLEAHRHHWANAERLLIPAVEQAPNNVDVLMAMGSLLNDVGRVREALEYHQRAAEREPLSMLNALLVAVTMELTGDLEGSLRELERAKQLEGSQASVAGPALAVELQLGDRARIDAAATLAIRHDLLPGTDGGLNRTMHAHLDDPQAAIRKLREFLDEPAFDNTLARMIMALWASYFGDDDFALALIALPLVSQSVVPRVIWRQMHAKMRQLPEFKDLLRQLGLLDYWRETGKWGDYVRPVGDDDFECI